MFDRKSCRLVQGGPAHLFGDISPRSAIMVIRTAVPHEFECGSLNAVARTAGLAHPTRCHSLQRRVGIPDRQRTLSLAAGTGLHIPLPTFRMHEHLVLGRSLSFARPCDQAILANASVLKSLDQQDERHRWASRIKWLRNRGLQSLLCG